MNQSLQLRPTDALTVADILSQKALIQDAMKSAMQDGQHFGKIPGCGDKPTLLQPGAQTILLLFRMNPDYDVEVVNLDRNHREYRVKCRLTNSSAEFIGSGVGSCSTMEGKWRFRVAPKTLTDREVPKAYWDARKTDPRKAQELLGGPGFSTKKNDAGAWMIAEGSSEKIEHENPADYYNTCLKMAKKRALVDATLTRTAASDCFTQDVEDLRDNMEVYGDGQPHQPPPAPTATAQAEKKQPPAPAGKEQIKSGEFITAEAKLIKAKEAQSKPDAPKPWKALFCTFEDAGGTPFEVGTFDHNIIDATQVLLGSLCTITYRPGKKPGTFELLSIEPADLPQM